MVADTLRQKFIYATPYDKDEFPLVDLDRNINLKMEDVFRINASELYFIEKEEFESLVSTLKSHNNSVLIINDYNFKSSNVILHKGCLCHMLSFAYLFKTNNIRCNII